MVLLREIKRRRVLHTLSLYILGCWVALQVVEVLSGAGLPPETMRYLLIAMSFGFPVVLLIAWLFDVSTEGITRTRSRTDDAELPALNLSDHALLVGILAVLALNSYVLSSPPPDIGINATPSSSQTLAVLAFEDQGDVSDNNAIGAAIAGEIRNEFQRVAGLRVLGPESSRVLLAAGDARDEIASELGITTILTGDVRLSNGQLELTARAQSIPAGNIVWQSDYSTPVGEGPDLQRRIVKAILDAVIPTASADVAVAPRVAAGECTAGYDLYLRGKQFAARGRIEDRMAALELMNEAVRLDPDCGIAWETIAVLAIDWTKEGFAKAGAAARRALEINDSLSKAWATMAEIAEEEQRWSESERMFLRALYANPTDGITNAMYAETLLARGRVSDAMHYALEGYRYEPASSRTNYLAAIIARYLGEPDLVIKHAQIFAELRGDTERYGWDNTGEAYILRGEIERAAALYESKVGTYVADWYPQCVRSLADPTLRDGLVLRIKETIRQLLDGELPGWSGVYVAWHVIRCTTWLNEIDMTLEFINSVEDQPTEVKFLLFFQKDSSALRQTEQFRNLVVDSGLLDYWHEWGFSDYCRPDGDSFACD